MDTQKFYSLCAHGNVSKALSYLTSITEINPEVTLLKRKFIRRFVDRSEQWKYPSDDPWICAVLDAYYSYFQIVLMTHDLKIIQHAEKKLITDLGNLIKRRYYSSMSRVERLLKRHFQKKGYSFLGGVTVPYYGPYIWHTTQTYSFTVQLPLGTHDMTVHILSDFILLSWIDFATFGKRHTGGWANKKGLYYVNTMQTPVDTSTPKFQVWFLKHEAQHQSDYKHYPHLNQAGLEYRAKLVELMYHPNPEQVLEKFTYQAKNDRLLPHPYAAYSIISRLSEILHVPNYMMNPTCWYDIPKDIIATECKTLFLKSEEQLRKKGRHARQIS